MSLLRLVRQVHAWSGAIAGGLIALVALTGVLLLLEPAYLKLVYAPAPMAQGGADPAALGVDAARLRALFPGEIVATLRTPQPDFPVWRVYLDAGGGAFVEPSSLRILDQWAPLTRLHDIVYVAHTTLFAGHEGEYLVGALGVASALFVVSGLLLWATARGARAYRLWPASLKRPEIVRWHRDAGAASALFIALSALTGAGMALPDLTEQLLTPIVGAHAAPPDQQRNKGAPGEANAFVIASEAVEGGRVQLVLMPLSADDPITYRVRAPGEWHPNGRSLVTVDPTEGQITYLADARAARGVAAVENTLYPLHAGIEGAPFFSVILFIAGALYAALAAFALYTFIAVRLRRRDSAS